MSIGLVLFMAGAVVSGLALARQAAVFGGGNSLVIEFEGLNYGGTWRYQVKVSTIDLSLTLVGGCCLACMLLLVAPFRGVCCLLG